jgi:hypothetical protein
MSRKIIINPVVVFPDYEVLAALAALPPPQMVMRLRLVMTLMMLRRLL